ncbi:MAG TPA: DNA-3-methyladenine glycosylase I [Acidiferrobacteraceae bacterium]|nr:DNA-3-methyladenine glycosylase I [Acidiferrobacteraceae bacterium]
MKRCEWARAPELNIVYHDEEWGVPSHDDTHLFEMLILEGAQAGLSWTTILKKRQSYREAYEGFDPERVARFSQKKCELLLKNPGIVRNRLKVAASVQNAKAFLDIQESHGSFSEFIWEFVDAKPLVNKWRSLKEIPVQTTESQAMSRELKKRGFKFVGPTICYAFMQAVGMVNDHEIGCFRYKAFG